MYKNLYRFFIITVLFVSFSFVSAQTKPSPGTDPATLSYEFYLYYDNGQLFGDRDHTVNFDVVSEVFVPETVGLAPYKGEITNNRSEIVKTFTFDPQKGNANFKSGKVVVKGPYAPDGFRVNFYDPLNNPVLAIFVSASSICDGDGFCNAQLGEDTKTCPTDCQAVRTSPLASITPLPLDDEGFNLWGFNFDLIQIATYAVGALGVAVIAWLGWKWWKKRKEGDFPLPPPSSMPPPSTPSLPSFGG